LTRRYHDSIERAPLIFEKEKGMEGKKPNDRPSGKILGVTSRREPLIEERVPHAYQKGWPMRVCQPNTILSGEKGKDPQFHERERKKKVNRVQGGKKERRVFIYISFFSPAGKPPQPLGVREGKKNQQCQRFDRYQINHVGPEKHLRIRGRGGGEKKK